MNDIIRQRFPKSVWLNVTQMATGRNCARNKRKHTDRRSNGSRKLQIKLHVRAFVWPHWYFSFSDTVQNQDTYWVSSVDRD